MPSAAAGDVAKSVLPWFPCNVLRVHQSHSHRGQNLGKNKVWRAERFLMVKSNAEKKELSVTMAVP